MPLAVRAVWNDHAPPMERSVPSRPDDGRSDEELLRACRRGDGAAFAAFYLRHSDAVTLYFVRRTYNVIESTDLAEETFAQALRSVHRYRERLGEPRAWLFGIARNLLRGWYRTGHSSAKSRRRLALQRVVTEDEYERVEELADVQALSNQVRDALATLTPALRDAVILRVNDQRPYEEVAATLGCSVGAARVRVNRALAQLNDVLSGDR